MKKILFLIMIFTSSSILAETAFVSDELDIMVRSGKSPSHRIVATLKSGTPLNTLERDKASGYTKISLSNNREGWVLSRLLTKTPSAKTRLAKAEKSLAKISSDYKAISDKLLALDKQKGSLDTQAADLQKSNTELSRELTQLKKTSSNAVQILQERNQLQQRVVTIERELETLKRENDILKNSSAQDWFLVGSGVLLLGIILGFILPKISWRKKSSWESSF